MPNAPRQEHYLEGIDQHDEDHPHGNHRPQSTPWLFLSRPADAGGVIDDHCGAFGR